MFLPFVIAVYNFFRWPTCEKMDLKIIDTCKWFKYAEYVGKPKNVHDLEDFSEEK